MPGYGWGFGFDPLYLLMTAPAVLLMLWAQARVKWAYSRGMQVDARLSGAAAARHILDQSGLHDVGIEQTGGYLSDHYDPGSRVLRLSQEVYHSSSATAVGIAAHEAGHAIQHARNYGPLVLRSIAVPAARFGPTLAMILFIVGGMLTRSSLGMPLLLAGLVSFGGVVFFNLVNLPVEFDASFRAKALLNEYQIVDPAAAEDVRAVLNAAGWTYVAGTLQVLMQFLYYAIRILGATQRRNDD